MGAELGVEVAAGVEVEALALALGEAVAGGGVRLGVRVGTPGAVDDALGAAVADAMAGVDGSQHSEAVKRAPTAARRAARIMAAC